MIKNYSCCEKNTPLVTTILLLDNAYVCFCKQVLYETGTILSEDG